MVLKNENKVAMVGGGMVNTEGPTKKTETGSLRVLDPVRA